MCTWSNWIDTMVDHSSFLKASNVCSLSLLTSFAVRVQNLSHASDLLIFPSLFFFLDISDSDIRSDTRPCAFWAVASRVLAETFAYPAPSFAPGNGAVASEHSSFTWHGLYSAGRRGLVSLLQRVPLVKNKVLNVFDCERHWGSRWSCCSPHWLCLSKSDNTLTHRKVQTCSQARFIRNEKIINQTNKRSSIFHLMF